ncbi:BRCA1-associated protein [Trichonephila clavipes]|uniref:BRCA1-associated protein n=1 Tax=Trichonephila clavipes TaxID=2585209 RepID=A0A8X7BK06_TRICX|nr:BRCA1-associated protein [Trichonephila clavipes]
MKIGNNGNLVLGPFDESKPCLMIVLMNCQTKLRINHLTAVKSVAILEKTQFLCNRCLPNYPNQIDARLDFDFKNYHTHLEEEYANYRKPPDGERERFQNDRNLSRCCSTGHPQVTTPNEDRYLAVTAKRNRRSTASDLSRQLSSATGSTVSRQIVYRRLEHIGLYAHRPVRCSTYRNSLSPTIKLE